MHLLETLPGNGVNSRLCLHRLCDGHWMESISLVVINRLLEVTGINDTNADDYIAMHYLVKHLDQIDAASHLINKGADTNVINQKGNTSLHQAIEGTLF